MTLDWLTYFPSPARGVWHLGPIPIRAYALCIIIGIIVALLIGDRRWQARGGEPGVIYDIGLWTVPFGLIGGRLYHLMTDWRTYFGPDGVGWQAAPRIWDGGLGIWGAVALGSVGAWIGCRRHGIPLPAFADAVAPGVVLAQAIGRIGNYFNQELYGRETTLPWGLEIFWRQDAAGVRDPHLLDGVSTGELYKIVQPTFLYELLWNVLVFLVLIYVDRRFRLGHGRLFALYVAGYSLGRFGIELLRDDAATHVAGIRINSFTATFVFIGAVVYFLLARKGREYPEQLRQLWQSPQPEGESEIEAVNHDVGEISIAESDEVTVEDGPHIDPDPTEAAGETVDSDEIADIAVDEPAALHDVVDDECDEQPTEVAADAITVETAADQDNNDHSDDDGDGDGTADEGTDDEGGATADDTSVPDTDQPDTDQPDNDQPDNDQPETDQPEPGEGSESSTETSGEGDEPADKPAQPQPAAHDPHDSP